MSNQSIVERGVYSVVDDTYLEREAVDIEYTSDIINLYLQEIRGSLLTREEEQRIGLRVLQGDKKAREILIEKNLRLVVMIAKRYVNRGLPLADLIQEGNIGLILAADRYNVMMGNRFSTYAGYWIEEKIQEAIKSQTRNIKVPSFKIDELNKMLKIEQELSYKTQGKPTIKDIAEEMGITESEVRELYRIRRDTVSLNISVGENEEDEEFGYFIASLNDLEEQVIAKTLSEELKKVMASVLSDREKFIIVNRFGLNGNRPKTQSEVANVLKIKRVSVDGIEKRILKKLKKSEQIIALADYTDNKDKSLDNVKEARKTVKEKKYQIMASLTSSDLLNLINSILTEKERLVATLRFGINGEEIKSLDEIGNIINFSVKTAAKIEASAIDKLYSFLQKENCFTYMDRLIQALDTSIDQKRVSIYELFKKLYRREPINHMFELLKEDEKDKTFLSVVNLSQKDVIEIFNILRSKYFKEIFSFLTVKEAIIVILALGYIDNKYHTIEALAYFFDMSPEEIKDVLAKLTSYKNNLVSGNRLTRAI